MVIMSFFFISGKSGFVTQKWYVLAIKASDVKQERFKFKSRYRESLTSGTD